ncbi:MAG TPA: sulfatase-like hydrolase/transferase, partial [Thermoanaerobaculia bacterium]|nr:sulfatase-like hydrolase/transferase [Thermoanaerobaculia bacterium]
LKASGYATGAAVSAIVLDRGTGIAEGFDFYDDAIEARDSAQAIGQLQRAGDDTRRRLEGWIASQPADGRLFAFFHLYEPHAPYEPPAPLSERYRSSPYDGEVAASDAVTGRFLDFLRERKIYDRALIVFLSDHGEGLGDHGEDEHGIFLYREAIRVPLFVKLPGGARAGTRVTLPVQVADLFPTVLAAVGESVAESLPGVSLLDFASGKGTARRIYSETVFPRYHFGWSDLASLTDDRHQYVHAPRAELYDWRADPGQKKDLAPGLPPAFRSMRAELMALDRPLQAPGTSDPETVRKLASLGYIGAASPDRGEALPDPKDRIGMIDRLKEASRLVTEFRDAEGIALLKRIAAENPRMLDAWETLARLERRAGRIREAITALERADRLAPGTPQIMLGLADLHLEAGDFAKARALAAAAGEAGAPGYREELAAIALASGDLESARRESEAVLARNPEARAPRLVLARVALARGDLPGSLAILDEALELDRASNRIPTLNLRSIRGDILARLGREKEAESSFRSEVTSYPENFDGWARLAVLYASQERDAELAALLSEMTSKVPTPKSYDVALRVCKIIGDTACDREWRRRKAGRFGARAAG